MMEPTVLVGAGTLAFLIISGILTAMHRTLNKIDENFKGLKKEFGEKLDSHEDKDQLRYEDTIQRLTRVETLVTANGHPKRRRAA